MIKLIIRGLAGTAPPVEGMKLEVVFVKKTAEPYDYEVVADLVDERQISDNSPRTRDDHDDGNIKHFVSEKEDAAYLGNPKRDDYGSIHNFGGNND